MDGVNWSDFGAKGTVALLGMANFCVPGVGSPISSSRHNRLLAVSLPSQELFTKELDGSGRVDEIL